MKKSGLKISPPIRVKQELGGGELCWVRFWPGVMEGQPTTADLLDWMRENGIRAIDDAPETPPLPGTELDFNEAAKRTSLWFFVQPNDAVHMRLRWAEAIDR